MSTDPRDHRLAVVGGGVMGTNIAALALGHGVPVVLVDVSEAVLAEAEQTVALKLRHAQLMGKLPAGRTPAKLVTSVSLADAADATTVIEAVTELPETKAKVLSEVSQIVRPGTLLISNTSCIPIDEMASSVARPEELVGVHFMNPAYMIVMVEVIRGPRSSDATLTAVTDLLETLGRKGLVVNDAPGFVINQVLHPLINSAAKLVQDGVATVEVVDGLLEGCLGHATGPLRTADLIGLDNLVDSLNVLFERTGDSSCRPCDYLLDLVRAGKFGRKTGEGFYDYGKVAS
ncbi:3-hydroxyacyl-CoA dehydrogenase family protein [Streptacidiphilus sp. P02-A3a]|uniref:3-hydroxyacyl-CoA dehydrogenase family protein n=1 Tax=Streptacidiphilus sp. P02-A3a TaxID=2704468 RepID=UPI0015F91FA3|nr:3-hydroxyacyl-CoA dehydrogenase family protein [Streptacidiphilus sp. P02-A3a]QMU69830.1 3-hydroxyacyl-CoA dehydrogenase family protein [Streptacidiphilus sp. P02-A3a]